MPRIVSPLETVVEWKNMVVSNTPSCWQILVVDTVQLEQPWGKNTCKVFPFLRRTTWFCPLSNPIFLQSRIVRQMKWYCRGESCQRTGMPGSSEASTDALVWPWLQIRFEHFLALGTKAVLCARKRASNPPLTHRYYFQRSFFSLIAASSACENITKWQDCWRGGNRKQQHSRHVQRRSQRSANCNLHVLRSRQTHTIRPSTRFRPVAPHKLPERDR